MDGEEIKNERCESFPSEEDLKTTAEERKNTKYLK